MRAAYIAAAPDPAHFDAFLTRTSTAARTFDGRTDEQIRGIRARTMLVVGDTDSMPVAAIVAMQRLITDAQLAVLSGTTHMQVLRRTGLVRPLVEEFLG